MPEVFLAQNGSNNFMRSQPIKINFKLISPTPTTTSQPYLQPLPPVASTHTVKLQPAISCNQEAQNPGNSRPSIISSYPATKPIFSSPQTANLTSSSTAPPPLFTANNSVAGSFRASNKSDSPLPQHPCSAISSAITITTSTPTKPQSIPSTPALQNRTTRSWSTSNPSTPPPAKIKPSKSTNITGKSQAIIPPSSAGPN